MCVYYRITRTTDGSKLVNMQLAKISKAAYAMLFSL